MSQSERSPISRQQLARKLQLVWAMMLFSLFVYPFVLKFILQPSAAVPDRTFQIYLAGVGAVTALVVLYLRFVRIAALISPIEPMDERTLVLQANLNYMLCFVLSEATALFGFALAFVHGEPRFYVPLYLAGVLLMLLCYPRLPVSEPQ